LDSHNLLRQIWHKRQHLKQDTFYLAGNTGKSIGISIAL